MDGIFGHNRPLLGCALNLGQFHRHSVHLKYAILQGIHKFHTHTCDACDTYGICFWLVLNF